MDISMDFFNKFDYDVRKIKDARWIDQNVPMMYYGLLQIVYDPQLKAGNEYDKYSGQSIKLFSYSKLLNTRKNRNIYYYSINNREILEKIVLKPINALEFLYKK